MARKGYIVGPVYDGLFFIGSPLLALLLGYGVAYTPDLRQPVLVGGTVQRTSDIAISVIIFAHLFLVFFRSHGNSRIFKMYPYRFTLVPLALFLACWLSTDVLVVTTVVAVWWDVYHSGLQTFGLGRIYDARAGNDPEVGRRLDYFFNLFLYAGPILGGAVLMDHLREFDGFNNPNVHLMFFAKVPIHVAPLTHSLTWAVLGITIPFLLYYLWAYRRLHQRGYKISWQKVTLFVLTSLVSVIAWGFNSFGQAFLIMNFFHAWQYFAIVWWSENQNLSQVFRMSKLRFGKWLTFLIVFGSAGAFGWWTTVSDGERPALFAASIVVSIMHFWYDGFIWSVRKKQIPS